MQPSDTTEYLDGKISDLLRENEGSPLWHTVMSPDTGIQLVIETLMEIYLRVVEFFLSRGKNWSCL